MQFCFRIVFAESLKNAYSAVLDTEIRSFGTSKEGWRWNYLIQNNTSRDDYSRLQALGTAMYAPSNTLYAATSAIMDMDNWMRVFALTALTGLADTYNNGLAHNIQLYVRPSDQKVLLFPWDQDHAFYYGSNTSMYGSGSHRLATIINLTQNRRLIAGHLRHLCQTAFTNPWLDPIINHLNSANVANKPQYSTNLRNWVTARRTSVLAQLAQQYPAVTFAVTTSGGADFTTTEPVATVAGTGWIDLHKIHVSRNGSAPEPTPVFWLNAQNWQVSLPVISGANVFTLTAINHDGTATTSDTITITNTGTIDPATSANLVISEINYHPAGAGAEEFIELQNIGSRPIDLTGVSFTAGVQFSFTGSAITTLAPGQSVLIVENLLAFTARYGSGLPIAGVFSPDTRLSNNGDHLTLRDRAAAIIAEFSYDQNLPWPPEADGTGYTLTLVRPRSHPDPHPPWQLAAQPASRRQPRHQRHLASRQLPYPHRLRVARPALSCPGHRQQCRHLHVEGATGCR